MTFEDDRDNHVNRQTDDKFDVSDAAVIPTLSAYGRVALCGWVTMMVVIAALSLWPKGMISDTHHLDKIGHFMAYAALAFVPSLFATSLRRAAVIALVIGMLGVGLEGAQILLPGRVPSWLDLGANVAGAILGTLAGVLSRPQLKWLIRQLKA